MHTITRWFWSDSAPVMLLGPAQTNLGDLVESHVIDFFSGSPLTVLWCGDFWLSWQLWRLINSTPGSSARESGPEDKSSAKNIRKELKMLHLFAHLTPPLVELTSDAHHASCDWLLQWKRTILDELNFFFFTPLTHTSESTFQRVRHLFPDKGQLRLYCQKEQFPHKVETLGSIAKC